jgi:hypothetical protein
MAVGLPLKTTYVDGEVFSASDINDTNGTVNLVGQTNNFYAGKNKVINGDFGIWQRGTSFSFSSGGGYTSDRFQSGTGSGGVTVVSRQTFAAGQTDVPNANFFLQSAFSTSGTDPVFLDHRIEDVSTFNGQTATLSFFAKVSSGTKSITPRFVQDFGSGGSSTVVTNLTAQTLTTSWQRFTVTATVPSVTGKTIGTSSYLRLDLYAATSGTITYSFADFQFEAGSTATAFQTATGTIGGELSLCQRYYYRTSADSANPFYGQGYNKLTTSGDIYVHFPETMRVSPTLSASAAGTFFYQSGGINFTPTAFLFTNASTQTAIMQITAVGLTLNQPSGLLRQTGTAFIEGSAEL